MMRVNYLVTAENLSDWREELPKDLSLIENDRFRDLFFCATCIIENDNVVLDFSDQLVSFVQCMQRVILDLEQDKLNQTDYEPEGSGELIYFVYSKKEKEKIEISCTWTSDTIVTSLSEFKSELLVFSDKLKLFLLDLYPGLKNNKAFMSCFCKSNTVFA